MQTSLQRQKLTPPQLAKLWGVSTAKIIAFIRSGELRAVNLAASNRNRPRYSIDVRDIEAFEQARSVVPDGGLSTTAKLRRRAAQNVKEFF
jgi:hypothetical protein